MNILSSILTFNTCKFYYQQVILFAFMFPTIWRVKLYEIIEQRIRIAPLKIDKYFNILNFHLKFLLVIELLML